MNELRYLVRYLGIAILRNGNAKLFIHHSLGNEILGWLVHHSSADSMNVMCRCVVVSRKA